MKALFHIQYDFTDYFDATVRHFDNPVQSIEIRPYEPDVAHALDVMEAIASPKKVTMRSERVRQSSVTSLIFEHSEQEPFSEAFLERFMSLAVYVRSCEISVRYSDGRTVPVKPRPTNEGMPAHAVYVRPNVKFASPAQFNRLVKNVEEAVQLMGCRVVQHLFSGNGVGVRTHDWMLPKEEQQVVLALHGLPVDVALVSPGFEMVPCPWSCAAQYVSLPH